MALQEIKLDRESFSCPICLDLLKDPVTLGCGHSYCMSCIQTNWDHEDQTGIYSCPLCGQTFRPWPVLGKNTMLADLVEEVKKTGLQAGPAGHCYAGPEDVACDVCTGRKHKALKSCLVCLASFCEHHLWPHLQSPAFKTHKLVEPNKKLQENICSQHGEAMKMFCRSDQQCICYLCSVDEHKGHDIVSAAAERTERQRELRLRRQTIHQRLQDRQRDVELLQQEEEAVNSSADKTVEDSEKTFTELICLLQKRSSDVKQQIRSQQETEVSRVKEPQERLEQEINELKREDDELKQLSHTEDPIEFLHNFPPLPLGDSTHSSRIRIHPLGSFEDVTAAVSQVRGRLEDILAELQTLLSQPEPKTRAEFLKYAQEITLDPNTANRRLLLSEGNRRVTCMMEDQSYSDHPHRFTGWPQVLSRESLTGRCYWEVTRAGGVCVAVTYKDISRAGWSCDSGFGFNDKSWGLDCFRNNLTFLHNKTWTQMSGPLDSRVGVYLDYTAGVLSFYSVSDTMILLHRVQTTFTRPLYAGVGLHCYGNTAELCELKETGASNSSDTETLQIVSQPEPKTRADFLKYAQEITLDPNTANEDLLLSERNRRVTLMSRAQSYSDHPHRFTGWPQVLSRESLTGRCYWEVEGGRGVGVAVTYEDIVRKRSCDSVFGRSDKSWGLYCYGIRFEFYHNNISTHGLCPLDFRVGVYLDHTAGVLSFYSVSDTMTLLHRVQTTFTQPLYAGVALYCCGATAELCELK